MCAMLTVYAENGGRDNRRAIDFALPSNVKLVSFYMHWASIDLRHYTPAIAHIAHKLCELLISCTHDCQLGRIFASWNNCTTLYSFLFYSPTWARLRNSQFLRTFCLCFRTWRWKMRVTIPLAAVLRYLDTIQTQGSPPRHQQESLSLLIEKVPWLHK